MLFSMTLKEGHNDWALRKFRPGTTPKLVAVGVASATRPLFKETAAPSREVPATAIFQQGIFTTSVRVSLTASSPVEYLLSPLIQSQIPLKVFPELLFSHD